MAKCIVEEIKQNVPDLSEYIIDGFSGFDPAHPDLLDALSIQASSNSNK